TAQSIPATSSLFRSFSVAGDANLVATKILKDVALFGVTGSVVAKPGDCSLDGATNCVATSQYPAAKVADVAPADLRSGKTLGGVEGTLPACSTTSQDGCVTSHTVTALVLTELGNVIPCGSTFAGYTNPCLPGEWLFHPMVAANASSVTDGPGADYELGVEVRFKQPGSITKIRAYKALGEDGTHKARIWKAGQKVLEVDLPVIGALSGWMEVMLPTPYVVDQLAVDNAEIFTISSSINSHYPSVPATPWQTFSFPHVEFPFSYGANRAAVYNETPDNFPANISMYSQANYLVDFAFTADP
ncbi:MAG: DUF4082 domain-containing protein, partial [Silvanigrellales bacterium]|nr:DUF4082 domain-containing protein [Silvanigrellales bacterium]